MIVTGMTVRVMTVRGTIPGEDTDGYGRELNGVEFDSDGAPIQN